MLKTNFRITSHPALSFAQETWLFWQVVLHPDTMSAVYNKLNAVINKTYFLWKIQVLASV